MTEILNDAVVIMLVLISLSIVWQHSHRPHDTHAYPEGWEIGGTVIEVNGQIHTVRLESGVEVEQ